MKKATVVILITLLAFGFLASAAEKTKVPLSAIKSTCYNEIDMTKAEFLLSEVGKECVTKDWLEANLPQTSAEETTTKDKPTKNLAEKLEDTQEWVIEPGEKVVLEDISMDIPTDFIIKEGGSLIIRNCDLYMVGQHHHDNYIEAYGSLSIINSNLQGEKWIGPYILSKDPNATIKIEESKLGKGPAGFHVDLRKGGSITLDEVDYLDALSIYGNKTAVEEGGSVQAQGSTINTLEFRLGSFTGDFRLEGLKPNMDDFSFNSDNFEVNIENSRIKSVIAENRGKKGEGELDLRVVNSKLYGFTAWEGGNVVFENTHTCELTLKNRKYHEFRNLPYNDHFSDRLLVDQPSRKIRFIDSSVDEDKPYCSRNSGINIISLGSDLKVVNSDLVGLTVGRNLDAKNTSVKYVQIYDNSGNLHFDNSSIIGLSLVVSVDARISGELSVKNKEINDWGGLKKLSLTRKFPIKLLEDGQRLENTNIELVKPDGKKVETVTTNSEGEAEVLVNFNKSNLRDTWTLQVPSLGINKPIEVLSDTPVILSKDREEASSEDNNPPSLITDFKASYGDNDNARLEWTNPDDNDLAKIVVRRKAEGYPSNHNDGKLVYENPSPSPKTTDSFKDSELKPDITYYYAVFSKDKESNWNNTVKVGDNAKTLASAKGEPITFPDQNLARVIRDAIGKPTGDIYPSDLTGLEKLDAKDNGIEDLTGIGGCVNLEKLYLGKNKISDLTPLTSLTNLHLLRIGRNDISNLSPVSKLNNLENLAAWNNEISDLSPLANVTHLKVVDMTGNLITDISPLSNLSKLTGLWLKSNKISDISPLADLTNLHRVDISGNKVTDIQPLVDNSDLGSGNEINLKHNDLDLSEGSEDMQNIQILLDRGIKVKYRPQR